MINILHIPLVRQERCMARIEASIDIAAPRTDVFRYCHDLDHRHHWDERVVGAEMISPRPVRRGSLVRIEAGRGGEFDFTWDGEYIEYSLPRRSALKVLDAAPSSPFKSGTETWEFTTVDNLTRLSLTWEYEPSGLLASISDTLGRRGSTRRAIQRSLKNLKSLVEAG
jgi:uncharacterized protein YndB with AHSA1/START domain